MRQCRRASLLCIEAEGARLPEALANGGRPDSRHCSASIIQLPFVAFVSRDRFGGWTS